MEVISLSPNVVKAIFSIEIQMTSIIVNTVLKHSDQQMR